MVSLRETTGLCPGKLPHSVLFFRRIAVIHMSVNVLLWEWKRLLLQFHRLLCAVHGAEEPSWPRSTPTPPLVIHKRVVITVGGGVTLLPMTPHDGHRVLNQARAHARTHAARHLVEA